MKQDNNNNTHNINELRLVWYLVMLIGIGYLFPFSALTQPIDFWNLVFPDFNIEFPLSTLYMWTNLILLGVIVFFGKKPSFSFRLIGGFLGQFLALIIVPTMYFYKTSEIQYFWIIMGTTGLAAGVTAFVDSVVISFASQFPKPIIESLQLGIGLSTLIGCLYRIFTKLVLPNDTITSSIMYFYSGAFTILICIIGYCVLIRLPIAQYYLNNEKAGTSSNVTVLRDDDYITILKDEEIGKQTSTIHHNHNIISTTTTTTTTTSKHSHVITESSSLLPHITERHTHSYQTTSTNPLTTNNTTTITNTTCCGKNTCTCGGKGSCQCGLMKSTNINTDTTIPLIRNRWIILRHVWKMQFLLFLTYFSTMLVWPGIFTEIRSYQFLPQDTENWWSLLLFLQFSVLDCIGRLMTPHRMGLTNQNIHYIVLIRLGLLPLIIFCAMGYITNDLLAIGLIGLIGFTNGYIGSLCIIFATELVDSQEEKAIVGGFTSFFLNVGLVLGTTAAYATEKLVKLH